MTLRESDALNKDIFSEELTDAIIRADSFLTKEQVIRVVKQVLKRYKDDEL